MRFKLLIIISLCLFSHKLTANKTADINAITLAWHTANNSRNVEALKPLYNQVLVGYGKHNTLAEFLNRKTSFFNKYPDYEQEITSNLTIKQYDAGIYKCEFLKQANAPQGNKTYPSYLIFQKIRDSFLIIEEGDEITNANVNYQPKLGIEKSVQIVNLNHAKTADNSRMWLLLILSTLTLSIAIVLLIKNRQSKKMIKEAINLLNSTDEEEANDSSKKGRLFEEYVVKHFNKEYFKIEHWQGDKGVDGRYAEANQNPDLLMRIETTSMGFKKFAIECKYRTNLDIKEGVQFCEYYQLKNYQNYAREHNVDVFLVLGIGGIPDNPNGVHVFNIMELSNVYLNKELLSQHYKKPTSMFYYNIETGVLK